MNDQGSLNSVTLERHKKPDFQPNGFPWQIKFFNQGPVDHALWAYTKAGPSGVGFLHLKYRYSNVCFRWPVVALM